MPASVLSMLQEVEDYYWLMASRGRLITADVGEGPVVLCTFFVLDDDEEIPKFYSRPVWSLPDDLPDGRIVYVDKLIAKVWDRTIFREIEALITEKVPSWEKAVWYRPGLDADRQYVYSRRTHGAEA